MSTPPRDFLEQFQAWFDLIGEPIVLVSHIGTIEIANREFLETFGPENAVGRPLSEWVVGPADRLRTYLADCSTSGRRLVRSLILRDARGRTAEYLCEGTAIKHDVAVPPSILLRMAPAREETKPQGMRAGEPSGSQLHSPDPRGKQREGELQIAHEVGLMGIWKWNISSDELVWFPGLGALHGRADEGFLGILEEHQKDILRDDRQAVTQAIQETLRTGKDYFVQHRLLWPDGSTHWIEDRGKLLYGDRGEITALITVSHLIDQRKHLEEQLRYRMEQLARAEARVCSVVENVVDGIITINERGMIQTVNPAAERLFGYSAEEMIGQNVKMLMPEPYRSQHDRYLANYLTTGQAKIIGIGREVLGKRKDGSQFPLYLGVSEVRLDGERSFTGIVRDLTEQKRAENTAHFLADASRSLAAIVDYKSTLQKVAYLAVPFFAEWSTVHVAHEDGSLRQLAAAHIDPDKSELARELGEQAVVHPGAPVGPSHVFMTGKAELTPEVSDDLIESVAPDPEHQQLLRHLGLYSCLCVPLVVRGKVFGVISFFSADPNRRYDAMDLEVAEDLAHRAATAIENSLLYRDLREADRRKDEFLAMLAHELRNPLSPIRSGVDLLAMSGADPEVVRVMQQQSEHLVRLVDDLLDVSRIMRGKVELLRGTVDVRSIVQRAIDAVHPAISRSEQELTVSVPSTPIYVYADPVRLTQVLTNFLTNSNRYTGRGGHIWLTVEPEDQGVAISVRDDGIGISSDLLPHVFDLFSQADRSLERTQGGLGIGLTLVRSLIEMHDGTVTAFSEGEGKGAKFVVHLPVQEIVEQAPPVETKPPEIVGRRILIVEDNVGTAKVLSRLLAKLGNHDIRMVHDGLSALEAKEHRPEIILLDIGLPQMNGYEVAQRLRQQPEFQDTVLVALTGYGTEEDRRRSAEVGFDRHLVKPPSLDQLRQVLVHLRLAHQAT